MEFRESPMEGVGVSFGIRPEPGFWARKRVLLTGHTGFKGGWLALWLRELGADVTGISLPPNTTPNLFSLAKLSQVVDSHLQDIRDSTATAKLIQDADPEIAFHLAAQPLVRTSYRDPLTTFATNVQGTAHVLDALRDCKNLRAIVAVTTDKVYQNLEHAFPYRETDLLGGHDPYSASKAAAEIVISCYRNAFFQDAGVAVASARAGNVIGGGDWSEDRLIPDAVRAWSNNQSLEIRRPNAVRPWQHVLEPLNGYLLLAQSLWADAKLSGAYNFGPHSQDAVPVRQLIRQARDAFGQGDIVWGDGTHGPHEAGQLALEISKARQVLNFVPRWSISESIRRTMTWYRQQADGVPTRDLCLLDLEAYSAPTADAC
jgi:CDP-glucose 4,6-dehydratase